jgi:hypothetical protein
MSVESTTTDSGRRGMPKGGLGASLLAAGVLPLTTAYSITEAIGLEGV